MVKSRAVLATKGDLLAVSKHAGVSLMKEDDFVLFWFNTPKKGKCLSVEYATANYPAVTVSIEANWRQRRYINRYRKDGWEERVF